MMFDVFRRKLKKSLEINRLKYLKNGLVLFGILKILDYVTTTIGINKHGLSYEANYFVRYLIRNNYFLGTTLVIVLLLSISIYYLTKYETQIYLQIKANKKINYLINFLLVFVCFWVVTYGLVCLNNLTYIT